MRVGLLGGSFDPIHFGHLRAAEWARFAFALDEVRLMPARQSPFKPVSGAGESDRAAMVRLAIAENDALSIEPVELERPAPSYTVDTLRALGAPSPDRTFVLLLGSDAAAGLDKWREIGEIRRMAEIRVLARPGAETVPDAVPFAGLSISASEIRDLVRAKRSIRYLTPEAVRRYILEKGLYQ